MTEQDLERVDQAYRRIGSRWAWGIVSFGGFQGFESSIRRRTVDHLSLHAGDSVLDVACGRGSNFVYLQRIVGEHGRIVGVDYSASMLRGAEASVRDHGWSNVQLVRGDAAELAYDAEFDGALCTIAMTVIPRWQEALRRMMAAVRPGKRIAVMDGRRPTGLTRIGLPYALLFSRLVAADLNRDVQGECRHLLVGVQEEKRMFGNYFIFSGTSGGRV